MQERRGWIRRALDEAPAAPPKAAAPATGERATTIEYGCEIEGTFQLPGPLVVDGHFRGAIECRDAVTVREQGSVEARIKGRSVEIRGAVVGDVEALREVVLRSGARLHGDVKTPSLVVERGAFWTGRTEMYRPQAVARDRAAEAPPVAPNRPGEAAATAVAPGRAGEAAATAVAPGRAGEVAATAVAPGRAGEVAATGTAPTRARPGDA